MIFRLDQFNSFRLPVTAFASLSRGSSTYAYTPVPDSAATGGESGTVAAERESGTAFAEAGSTLLGATPVAYETEEEGGDDDGGGHHHRHPPAQSRGD
ncbi:MAG TPA: hypothetical protein VEA60_00755, partial [Allosphingosinicella sp.]|nr:hypothetical protein [Allosphingosinicella sp.]